MKDFSTKRLFAVLLVAAMIITSFSVQDKTADAASKNIKSISLKIGTKNVTKKTFKITKGKSKQLKVAVKPALSKKSVTYQSKNEKIVTVSKKGKVTAKKVGTVKIIVTVNGKKGQSKQTWVKIKVNKKKELSADNDDNNVNTGDSNNSTLDTNESKNDTDINDQTQDSNSNQNQQQEDTANNDNDNDTNTSNNNSTSTIINGGSSVGVIEGGSSPAPTPDVTPETEVVVNTPEKLLAELEKQPSKIVYKTDEDVSVEIPEKEYLKTTLVIDAANATITNLAKFDKIEIKAIKPHTWIEKAIGNIIDIIAGKAHIVVDKDAVADIEVSTGAEKITIENQGRINGIEVSVAATVVVTTSAITNNNQATIPIKIAETAKNAFINTVFPVEMNAKAAVTVRFRRGSEKKSAITVSDTSALPTIIAAVIGSIQVTNQQTGKMEDVDPVMPDIEDEDDVVPVKAVKAEVVSTDRLELTFDQAVNAATFYNKDKTPANGVNIETGTAIPPKYFNLLVRDHVPEQQTNTISAYYYTNRVQAILQGKDDKTLVFVFENGFELADNTKFVVDFTDMRNGITQSDRLSNYIADMDAPKIQRVQTINMKTIRVYFDQPVVAYSNPISNKNNVLLPVEKGVIDAPAGYNTAAQYNFQSTLVPSALRRENFFIDGINLSQNATYLEDSVEKSYFGNGNAVIKLTEGYENARNVIDITLGTYRIDNDNTNYQSYFKSGSHVIQISNVGDYASLSETNNNNRMTTQNFDFTVNEDKLAPDISIEAQSPEQYIITFNCQIEELAGTYAGQVLPQSIVDKMGLWLAFKDSARIADGTTKQTFAMAYETNTRNPFTYSWETAGAGLGQDIKVTRLTDDKGRHRIKVEVVKDWTQLQDYKDNNKTYTAYELYMDFIVINNGNASLTNAANGAKCTSNIVKRITGDAVQKLDDIPPTITKIEQIDNTRTLRLTFNEPVQAGNKVFEQAAYYGHQWTPRWNNQTKQTEKMADMSVRLVNDTTGNVCNAVNIIGYADLEDYMIDVEVQENLEPGTYTAYVTGVSDDYGNTCATEESTFVVDDTISNPASEFRILSIFADKAYEGELASDNNGEGIITLNNHDVNGVRDAVYVEFSTQYAATPIANSVLNCANWTLNGASLPIGTMTVAGVKLGNGSNFIFTGGRSGVTIILPDNTLTDLNTTMIKIASNVVSADNTSLGGQYIFTTPSILDREEMPGVIMDDQISELKNIVYAANSDDSRSDTLVKDLNK